MAGLALEEQPLAGAVLLAGIPAFGACLARVVRVHFDGHTGSQQGFVGKEAVQFGKRPRRGVPVGPALFLRCLVALLPPAAVADVGQVF